MTIPSLASLKKLFSLDMPVYLSILITTLSVIVLLVSSFTFFIYLYQPIFSPVDIVFLVNPSINYELLNRATKELGERSKTLTEKLNQSYPDPFE